MKKLLKAAGRNWITIWLILAVVLLVSFVSYAEYMERQSRIGRVVANTSAADKYFTSDYLFAQTTELHCIYFAVGSVESACEISFKIRNYDPATPAKFFNKELAYTLTAQLVRQDGTAIGQGQLGSYAIGIKRKNDAEYCYFGEGNYAAGNGYRLVFPMNAADYFDGNTKEEREFVLCMDKQILIDQPDLYVKLIAAPADRNLDTLQGILGVTAAKADLTQGWAGSFNDSTATAAYDGFNYVISGNGAATIKFGWRTDRFEANRFVLEDMAGDIAKTETETVGGAEWKFIYIRANANDTIENSVVTRYGVERYDIQLYMTGNADSDYNDWGTIESYVFIDTNAQIP